MSPGALLVTDGKTLDIELNGSAHRIRQNLQGIVGQVTGFNTAVVATDEEDAEGVRHAFAESVAFLGGVPPEGLLHDIKPCYRDAALRHDLDKTATMMVPAPLGRPENRTILEGAFPLRSPGRPRSDWTTPAKTA